MNQSGLVNRRVQRTCNMVAKTATMHMYVCFACGCTYSVLAVTSQSGFNVPSALLASAWFLVGYLWIGTRRSIVELSLECHTLVVLAAILESPTLSAMLMQAATEEDAS